MSNYNNYLKKARHENDVDLEINHFINENFSRYLQNVFYEAGTKIKSSVLPLTPSVEDLDSNVNQINIDNIYSNLEINKIKVKRNFINIGIYPYIDIVFLPIQNKINVIFQNKKAIPGSLQNKQTLDGTEIFNKIKSIKRTNKEPEKINNKDHLVTILKQMNAGSTVTRGITKIHEDYEYTVEDEVIRDILNNAFIAEYGIGISQSLKNDGLPKNFTVKNSEVELKIIKIEYDSKANKNDLLIKFKYIV